MKRPNKQESALLQAGKELAQTELAQLRAERDELRECLVSILNHVEDDTIQRINNQCTLCYTYRNKAHIILTKTRP